MKQNRKPKNPEFSERLNSSEWNRKMHSRIDGERKERMHTRVRVMAFVSALFIGAMTLTATWWDDNTTGTQMYSLMTETAGTIQGHFSE